MAESPFLTVPQIARETGAPDWRVRRVVDALGATTRAGQYRLVPRDRLPEIALALSQAPQRKGAKQ